MHTGKENIALRSLLELWTSGDKDNSQAERISDLFPDIVYVYDIREKKMRYVSPGIENWLGYNREEATGWTDTFSHLVFAEDQPLVNAAIDQYESQKEEDHLSYKCRLNNKGGDFRYFRTTGTALRRDDSGRLESLLFIAEDITDEVNAEQERLRLLEVITDNEKLLRTGIWNIEPATGSMDWSEGMYMLTGYTREELPVVEPSWFWQQVAPADRASLEKIIQASATSGDPFSIDFHFIRKDGARMALQTIGKAVKGKKGEVTQISTTNRDITHENLLTQEFQANKALLLQTEQMLNYGTFSWDLVRDEITWTTGLYEIFDVAVEDRHPLVPTNWLTNRILEEDREKVRQCVDDAIAERHGFECEYNIQTDKGVLKIVSSKGNIILDDNRLPIRMVGNTRDITPFRKVESELKRNLRELNRSNMELEEFAYAASHDMQEPLRKITTFGSRLKHKYGDLLGEEGLMYIDRMQMASDNMRTLIDNLLELSRVSRATQLFEPIDLSVLVKSAMSDLDVAIDEKKARVTIGDLPVIDGIPSQLRQLFTNLVSNALKFAKVDVTPQIDITSSRLSRREKEDHFLLPDKNYFRIDVRDNGIGFDQEYEQRIFQIFQRLHGKSAYPGSGIGLSICKKIAERHQGLISAEGKSGEGAVFSIILPENQ